MADTYLTYPYEFQGGRKAVASQVNANFEAVKQFANGVNVTIDELKNAISDLKNKSSREMLDVFFSFSSTAPVGAYPLWTGETILYCKNLYPQFWKKINNMIKLGSLVGITSEEYEERLEKYGQCGAFYIDELNGHLRLPKITRFISSITETAELAKEESAGLPNITGGLSTVVGYGGLGRSGAFSDTTSGGLAIAYHQGGTFAMYPNFNASKSNEIYGASETVQPPAVHLCLYLQVANNNIELSELDVHAIVTELEVSLERLKKQYEDYETELNRLYGNIKDDIIDSTPIIKVKDYRVGVEDFIKNNLYEEYPYCASLSVPESNEKMVPTVNFGINEAQSGNFAPIAECKEGVVEIYAKEEPETEIIIPSIVLE